MAEDLRIKGGVDEIMIYCVNDGAVMQVCLRFLNVDWKKIMIVCVCVREMRFQLSVHLLWLDCD